METNHLGNSIQMVYDGINRLVEKRDAYGMVRQQLMYNDGNAQELSFDALGNETRFYYDKNLRQAGTKDVEENRTYIYYNSRGNISSKKDGNGNTTTDGPQRSGYWLYL